MDVGFHIGWKRFAVVYRKADKTFFAGVQLSIYGKDDIKIASKEGSQPMVDAHKILSCDRLFYLLCIRWNDGAQHWIIHRDNVLPQAFRVFDETAVLEF